MSIIPVFAEIFDLLLSNPLLAWLTLVSAFAVDSWIASYVQFSGIAGWIATQALRFLSGTDVEVTSFQMLVVIVIIPIVIFVLEKSRQLQNT